MALPQLGGVIATWLLQRYLMPAESGRSGWPIPKKMAIYGGLILLAGWLVAQSVFLIIAALIYLGWPTLQPDDLLLILAALSLGCALLIGAALQMNPLVPEKPHKAGLPHDAMQAFMRGWSRRSR